MKKLTIKFMCWLIVTVFYLVFPGLARAWELTINNSTDNWIRVSEYYGQKWMCPPNTTQVFKVPRAQLVSFYITYSDTVNGDWDNCNVNNTGSSGYGWFDANQADTQGRVLSITKHTYYGAVPYVGVADYTYTATATEVSGGATEDMSKQLEVFMYGFTVGCLFEIVAAMWRIYKRSAESAILHD